MVHPRLVRSISNVHAVVDDVDNHLQDGCNNLATSRAARREPGLAVGEDNNGRHGTQRPLKRFNGVGLTTQQPIDVWRTRFRDKIFHLVVKQESGSGHRDCRAVRCVQRVRVGYDIAVGIHHRKMRRVFTLR